MGKHHKNGAGGKPPAPGAPANDVLARPEPPPAMTKEQQELAAMAMAQAIATTAALLSQLFPHVPHERVKQVAERVSLETPALREQILTSVLAADEKLPFWGVKIHGPVGVFMLHVPKRLPAQVETETAWQYASAIGLLMDPLMRGTVLLSGLRYEFFQTPVAPPGARRPSGIIT